MITSFLEAFRNVPSIKLYELSKLHKTYKECQILPTEYFGLNLGTSPFIWVRHYAGIIRSKKIWKVMSAPETMREKFLSKESLLDYVYYAKNTLKLSRLERPIYYCGEIDTINRNNLQLNVSNLIALFEMPEMQRDIMFVKPLGGFAGSGIIEVTREALPSTEDEPFGGVRYSCVLAKSKKNLTIVVLYREFSVQILCDDVALSRILPVGTRYIVQPGYRSYLYDEEKELNPVSIRMLVGFDGSTCKLLSAVQKFKHVDNITDNFDTAEGSPGNKIATIADNGTIGYFMDNRRTSGEGLSHSPMVISNFTECRQTIESLSDYIIQEWKKAYPDETLNPFFMGWDVIVTAKGMAILEVNTRPGFEMHQLVFGDSIMSIFGRFRHMVEHRLDDGTVENNKTRDRRVWKVVVMLKVLLCLHKVTNWLDKKVTDSANSLLNDELTKG